MIATMQLADVGVAKVAGLYRRRPRVGKVPGLRQADFGIAAPFGPGLARPPQFGRAGLVAMWDDDAAVDDYFSTHPFARALEHGWRVRLEPLRMHGSWPGVPDDLPKARTLHVDGPFVTLTIARLRPSQAPRFFKTNASAERGVNDTPGSIWTTAVALPPFISSWSLWESEGSIADYAFREGGGHANAIVEQRRKDFHRQSAFIRFRPYQSEGSLQGRRNALPAGALG